MNTSPDQAGYLLQNILLFGRLLRGLGFDVNPERMITLVQALDHIEIGSKSDFYHTALCLLVHNRDHIPLFDQAFDLFWQEPDKRRSELVFSALKRPTLRPSAGADTDTTKKPKLNSIVDDSSESDEEESPEIEVTRTYSARELLRKKDFAELSPEEIKAVRAMMTELLWQLGQQRTRRHKPGSGKRIDMRLSLRRSLRTGGEILEWSYRRPKYRPRPLVVIADISGSMERYTRMLLHFIYSLRKGMDQPVEAFLFGTRLTRITRHLRDSNVDRAMEEVSRAVPDWSGGTRIGQALRRFNFDWARRVLGQGAVVLLISDGWDRGDPNLLADEIARLQRSSFRLIWLNPLLGSADYEPLTRGMQAALPYVDDFLAVHNLASIEELALKLLQLNDRRTSRRQHLSTGAVF